MTDNQNRITLNLSIDFDIDSQYKDRIIPIMEEIVGSLSFSSSGQGTIKPGSTYQYKLTSNQPSQPMTMEKMFQIIDAHRAPGEATMEELLADSMHPEYELAMDWWEGLAHSQKEIMRKMYEPPITTVTQAWETYKQLGEYEKRAFDLIRYAAI